MSVTRKEVSHTQNYTCSITEFTPTKVADRGYKVPFEKSLDASYAALSVL